GLLVADLRRPGAEATVAGLEVVRDGDGRFGHLMESQPSTSDTGRGPGPTYFALGRTSRPVAFCSRMCALQPAVREHANIDVNMCGGTSAKSRTTADQNSTF